MIRHNYRPHVNRVHVNWARLEGTIAARSAPVPDAAAPAPALEPVAAPEPWSPEPPDYSTWRKADLVVLADERGLDSSGTKADLIERLSDG